MKKVINRPVVAVPFSLTSVCFAAEADIGVGLLEGKYRPKAVSYLDRWVSQICSRAQRCSVSDGRPESSRFEIMISQCPYKSLRIHWFCVSQQGDHNKDNSLLPILSRPPHS